jgi:hypothetical protein
MEVCLALVPVLVLVQQLLVLVVVVLLLRVVRAGQAKAIAINNHTL